MLLRQAGMHHIILSLPVCPGLFPSDPLPSHTLFVSLDQQNQQSSNSVFLSQQTSE
jgi:hypothetical protein